MRLSIAASACALAFATLVPTTNSAPSPRVPVAHGRRAELSDGIPQQYQLQGPSPDDEPYESTMHLVSQDNDGLTRWMEDNSKTLGNPLTQEELAKYVRPSQATLDSVNGFLKDSGVDQSDIKYSPMQDRVTFRSTAGKVSSMFGTKLNAYRVSGVAGDSVVHRTQHYTVPANVQDHVLAVEPLTSFEVMEGELVNNQEVALPQDPQLGMANTSICNENAVIPRCLREYYGFANYTPKPVNGSADVFVLSFLGQNFSSASLGSYMDRWAPGVKDYDMPVINRGGGRNDDQNPSQEAMVATEVVSSLTAPLNNTFFNWGSGTTMGNGFNLALVDIIENYEYYGKPGVVTASFLSIEIQADYDVVVCQTAQKLTALGTTILFAAGDAGVNGLYEDASCPPFKATIPAGCPYILVVGATQGIENERATDKSLAGFYSGGGFSNRFPRPSYQEEAVTSYLNQLGPINQGFYNASGRAYPDVSAQGSRYVATVKQGTDMIVSGTSVSTPLWASIVALLNSARRQEGKGNVGWLNPTLYFSRDAFKDIQLGRSGGCKGNDDYNFPALAGYDVASGLGTPMFEGLLKAVQVDPTKLMK